MIAPGGFFFFVLSCAPCGRVLSPFFFFLYDAVYLYNRPMYPLYLLLPLLLLL